MSIESLSPNLTTLLRSFALPMGLHGENLTLMRNLNQLLHSNPLALLKDTALLDLIGQAKTLGNTIHKLQGDMQLRQNPQLYRQASMEAKQRLQALLDSMKDKVAKLLYQPSPAVTAAATERYGSDLAADVDRIMNSSASLEDKLAMLAGLMSDHLDQEIEKKMKEWSNELKKSQEGDAAKSPLSIALGVLGPVVPGIKAVADAIAPSSASGKTDQRDKQKIDQLQTQIQLLMDKKKNFLQMVSNLMAAESRTQNAIISNIRG